MSRWAVQPSARCALFGALPPTLPGMIRAGTSAEAISRQCGEGRRGIDPWGDGHERWPLAPCRKAEYEVRETQPVRVWHGLCAFGFCLFEIGSRIKELQTTLRTCGN